MIDPTGRNMRESLDRYITGNYGNDQYDGDENAMMPADSDTSADLIAQAEADRDSQFAAEMEKLPMPRGMVLRFQPMTISGLWEDTTLPVLAEGECGECGSPADPCMLSLEVKPEGCAISHQCRECGADNILAVYYARRDNDNRKGA